MGAGKYYSELSTRGGKLNFITESDILSGESLAKEILDEMKEKGIKYSKDKIVFAARLENGNKIFLEKSRVEHIVEQHASNFKTTFGVEDNTSISLLLSETISKGKLIDSYPHTSNGKEGYRSIYYYKGNYMIVYAISTNGYIETAFPIRYKGGKR